MIIGFNPFIQVFYFYVNELVQNAVKTFYSFNPFIQVFYFYVETDAEKIARLEAEF